MLMVSGPESEFTYPQETDVHETSKSLMSRAGEELGLYYARTYDLEVKIVRCPYLYAPQRNGVTAYFNGLFEQAQAGELRFHERAEQRTCFLCADDLPNLSTAYSTTGPPTASCSTFRTCSTSLTAIWER